MPFVISSRFLLLCSRSKGLEIRHFVSISCSKSSLERNRFSQAAVCCCSHCCTHRTERRQRQLFVALKSWNGTWMADQVEVKRAAHLSFWVSRQKQHSYQLPPLCNLSPFDNLMSYFSALIAGESSILVDAPGESMRVYSLPQRRWWSGVALWKRSSTVSLSTLSDNNAVASSLVHSDEGVFRWAIVLMFSCKTSQELELKYDYLWLPALVWSASWFIPPVKWSTSLKRHFKWTVSCASCSNNLGHHKNRGSTLNKSSQAPPRTSFRMFLIRAMCLVYYAPRRLLQIVGGLQMRSYSIISRSALPPWCDGGNSGVRGRTWMDRLQWETDCSLTPADLFCFLRISQWQSYQILLLLKYDWVRDSREGSVSKWVICANLCGTSDLFW